MHVSPPSYALPVCFFTLLAACGGGGGGGGGPVDVQFMSFSTIAPNQRANMNGISQTASGTATPVVGGFLVNSVAPGSVDEVNSRAQITFDANRNISAMSFTAPQSSAAFASGIDCSSGPICAADTATSAGFLGNPSFTGLPPFPAHNWNYQTFGVWVVLPSPTTFQVGAISVGAPTPGSAVPTSAPNATFTGTTSGFYTENTQPFFSLATVSATVDWSARSIAFSTSNTVIVNFNSAIANPEPQLNLTGTLTYNAGSNQFTSSTPLTAPRNSLSGSATGRFYGPTAQEMGGVYSLTGSNNSTLIGAFGARRP